MLAAARGAHRRATYPSSLLLKSSKIAVNRCAGLGHAVVGCEIHLHVFLLQAAAKTLLQRVDSVQMRPH